MADDTEHPFGIPKGTIEGAAFDTLLAYHNKSSRISDNELAITMLHSIATSLLHIADTLTMVTDAETETMNIEDRSRF